MNGYGECKGYTGEPCENCGRVRVEHYSKGFDVCEKCRWCKQLHRYVDDEEIFGKEEHWQNLSEPEHG